MLPEYNHSLSMTFIFYSFFLHDHRAKAADDFEFDIPGDVREETEVFTQSFGEDVVFTGDEKLRLPFIFE